MKRTKRTACATSAQEDAALERGAKYREENFDLLEALEEASAEADPMRPTYDDLMDRYLAPYHQQVREVASAEHCTYAEARRLIREYQDANPDL